VIHNEKWLLAKTNFGWSHAFFLKFWQIEKFGAIYRKISEKFRTRSQHFSHIQRIHAQFIFFAKKSIFRKMAFLGLYCFCVDRHLSPMVNFRKNLVVYHKRIWSLLVSLVCLVSWFGLAGPCRKNFAYWQSLAPYSAKLSKEQNFTSIFANFTVLAKFNFCEKLQFVENCDLRFWLLLRWMWNMAEYGFWRKHNSVCFGHFRKNQFFSVFANLTLFAKFIFFMKKCDLWKIASFSSDCFRARCGIMAKYDLRQKMAFGGFIIFRKNFAQLQNLALCSARLSKKMHFTSIFANLTLFAKFIFREKMRFVRDRVFRSVLFLRWWTFFVFCEFRQKFGCWPQIILRLVGWLAGWFGHFRKISA